MSVPSPMTNRLNEIKPAGLYLMELRRHVAEVSSRRRKLTVASWGCGEAQQVPILARDQRLAKAQA